MKRRKILSIFLALAMTMASLTGCGSGSEDTGSGNDTGTAQNTPAEETNVADVSEDVEEEGETSASAEGSEVADGYVGEGGSYSMYLRATFIDWINDLEWYKEAEKRTGVTVEYQKGSDSEEDVYSEIDQLVLSGTLTDCTMCRQAQANVYGAQGAFYDLKPLIEQYAPHIQAYLDSNPDYTSLVTNSDGSIYGLLVEDALKSSFIFYRQDHFDKAGIDVTSVKTIEDFTDALRKLKEYYSDVPTTILCRDVKP